jgi:hypothetical protein
MLEEALEEMPHDQKKKYIARWRKDPKVPKQLLKQPFFKI